MIVLAAATVACERETQSVKQNGPAVPRAARATIRDVAAAACVSPMTISNFINGRAGTMREETAKRIAAEIARLDYRPHSTGRALRTAKVFSVGMLIVDERPTFLADAFITQIVAGLTNALSHHGYGLLLQGVPASRFEAATFFHSDRTDGLCVFLSGHVPRRRGMLERVLTLGQPVIAFEETDELSFPDTCIVRQDNERGGRALGDLLWDRGARRFLLLVPSITWPTASGRRAGLTAFLKAKGSVASLQTVSSGSGLFGDTQQRLGLWLDANGLPDAIVAPNDQTGIAAMRLLQARGVGVPGQVMITGFNGFEFWQYSDPVLTTVRSPAYEMGARGAEEMIARLSAGHFNDAIVTLPVALQLGGST